jgi:hypothetical protein
LYGTNCVVTECFDIERMLIDIDILHVTNRVVI